MQHDDVTYYSILGVEEGSTFLEIKQRFQSLVRALHPDKNTTFDTEQKQRYLEIQNVWKILGNENIRQMYDEQLKRLRLEQQVLINEEISVAEMDSIPVPENDNRNPTNYTYPCRCGGEYSLDETYLLMNISQVILSCRLVCKIAMESIRALELYSGLGGMHFALNDSFPSAKVVAAVDISDKVNEVYSYNFPDVKVTSKGIEGFRVEDLDRLNFNMVLMSPPCQPFTRIGLQKDVNDPRTKSFIHFLSILPKLKTPPQYILLENVKGFEESVAHQELCKTVDTCGYCKMEFLLSPKHLGIPNSRLRYFMLARRNKLNHRLSINNDKIWTTLPIPLEELQIASLENYLPKAKRSKIDPEWDTESPSPVLKPIRCFMEKDVNKDYNVPEKTKSRYINVMDLISPDSTISTCFTKSYTQYAEGTGSVLILKGPETIHSLSTKKAEDYELRYFTPREVANLMCFPDSFSFPDNITRKQRYKMLGNSLNVKVVSYLISLLLLEEEAVVP